MSPSDAFLTVELFNARHANDVSKHLDSGACLSGLSPSEAHDIRARAAALRQSATGWGEKYWAEWLREARTGIKDSSHDETIMKEMAVAHPGFSVESLGAVYRVGLMLAR